MHRADDGGPAGLVGEPAGDEAEDPDRPRPADEHRGLRPDRRRHGSRSRRAPGQSSHACWPGASPGSGSPNAARASASAARIRSLRVALASSRMTASVAASSGVAASSSRAASIASPTRPAAFSRGASTKPTVSRSIAGVARARPARAAPRSPGRGAVAHPLEAEAGDRPVLAHDRRDVRDRPDRREVREVAGLRLGAEQLAEQQPRDGERDARPGQAPIRVGRVGALRVDDGDAPRAGPRAGDGGR